MAAVFLDPGHGGEPGAQTSDGRRESESNLRLALMLKHMLLDAGHSVMLSRETDRYVSLAARAYMARQWGADTLLSLHADVSASKMTHGHHAIYSVRDCDGQGYRLARLLVQDIHRATGTPAFARWGGPVWSKESEVLAGYDYFGIIRYARHYGIAAPVIVERGFLSNPEDSWLLFQDAFLQRQAVGIVAAVGRWEARPTPQR